ncbi:MAG: ABC transporter permease [Alphaproteobacteria bacterium]|nr:ABC transporter permease [Alphaproteobacteria bacterium]
MALPVYATPAQKIWHYTYLAICSMVLFFLVAPLIVVIPLSFTNGVFLSFTPEMLSFSPEGFSLKWYKNMLGMCNDPSIKTMCSDKWKTGAINSAIIAIAATALSTSLGTMAAIVLSNPLMAFRKLLMATLISPLIVPLIITASGMFLFYAKVNLIGTYTGLILAHAALGTPFVVITVTATLTGFDHNLTRASQNLGAGVLTTFFKVQMPLILPGVISGGLFAFITSFDEVVVVLFMGGPETVTLPRQMWSGIRQEISPTILAAATCLVLISILLLTTLELLRRRSDRLRGIKG